MRQIGLELVVLDSNIRDRYYRDIDFHNSLNKIFNIMFSNLPQSLMPTYFMPFLGFYEILGIKKMKVEVKIPHHFISELIDTNKESAEEVFALNRAYEFLFHEYKDILKKDIRLSREKINQAIADKCSRIQNPNLRELFLKNVAEPVSADDKLETLIEFLILELVADLPMKDFPKDRLARFWLMMSGFFLEDRRNNSLYRPLSKVWLDELLVKIKKLRGQDKYKNFSDEEMAEMSSYIRLKTGGEDLFDSEIVHYLVYGNYTSFDHRKRVMVITGDPFINVIHRIAFYKSMSKVINDVWKRINKPLPLHHEGAACILNDGKYKIVYIQDIPDLLYFIENNSYQAFKDFIGTL